jgi:sporulation protein YunB
VLCGIPRKKSPFPEVPGGAKMGKRTRQFQRWWRGKKKEKKPGGLTGWLFDSDAKAGEHTARTRQSRRREGFYIPRRYIVLTMLLALTALFVWGFYRFDRRILPLVLEAEELRIQAEINNVINSVVHEIIVANNITAADFILQNQIAAGAAKPVLSVNTVLVNEICNSAAQAISEYLNNLEPETVSVPLGMIFGLDTLAQAGPRFSFTMAPIGNALVNYETRFTAVGINQTHFSVWLNVESVVRIIKLICRNHNTCGKPACYLYSTMFQRLGQAFFNTDKRGAACASRFRFSRRLSNV